MNLVVSNGGALLLLNWMLQATSTPENLVVKAYSNDHVPIATDTAGSYTECAFTGYAAVTLSRATWGNAAMVSTTPTSTYGAAATFTNGGSTTTVYGVFVVGSSSGTLIFAQRFDTPAVLNTGNAFTYIPVMTLTDQ